MDGGSHIHLTVIESSDCVRRVNEVQSVKRKKNIDAGDKKRARQGNYAGTSKDPG